MNRRLLAGLGAAGLALVLSAQPAVAQGGQAPPPAPPTAADIDALRRQLQALAAGQLAIQKQLDEIKTLLQQGGAPRPAPAAPPRAPMTTVDTLVETAGAPSKGSATARLTIVEFSDFECPFCGRYSRDTYPALEREYIQPGKVRYVFRNYPLESIHPNAFAAAVASVCAGEQNRYWEMHDRLFANQTALTPPGLTNHAQALGLDMARFTACQANPRIAARVRQDQADAQKAGVGSTPAFLIGVTTPGDSKVKAIRMIRGAQPAAAFKAVLDALLAAGSQ